MSKERTDYQGRATIITARAKANATVIAALSGLLLAGGNLVNNLLDRHHQRQLDESTYNATLAEIRNLRKELDELKSDRDKARDKPAPELSVASAEVKAASPVMERQLKPDRDLKIAPSFKDVQQYVQRRGKPLSF